MNITLVIQLFISFMQVGMFSIGGAYAAMPLIQAQIVHERAWMSMNEFTDLITIAEMTPGPIALNAATFVGVRTAGLPGALAATFGYIFPSLIIVFLLAVVYSRWRSLTVIDGVLSALRPAVVALIASAGLSILLQVFFGGQAASLQSLRPFFALLFILALFALRRFRLSPILVMTLCGAASLLLEIFSNIL